MFAVATQAKKPTQGILGRTSQKGKKKNVTSTQVTIF
jgi:hypothetical protein